MLMTTCMVGQQMGFLSNVLRINTDRICKVSYDSEPWEPTWPHFYCWFIESSDRIHE